jgi:hypothetical protein
MTMIRYARDYLDMLKIRNLHSVTPASRILELDHLFLQNLTNAAGLWSII